MYHYVHSFAAMIEAQARMATGDTKGLSIFMDAQTEAQELADKSDIDPDLQKMAKNLVGNGPFRDEGDSVLKGWRPD